MSALTPHVLLLEDDSADATLIEAALGRSLPTATITHAATRNEYLALLAGPPVDVVLSDGSVLGCEGIEAFHLARRHDRDVSFLFISGGGRNPDLRALRALGVSDFLSKDDLDEVGPAIGRALTGRAAWPDQARLLAGYELVLIATRDLTLATDASAVMSIAQIAARRLTGADGTTFTMSEGEPSRYLDAGPAGVPAVPGNERPFPLGDCLSSWTMRHREPAVVDDAGTDARVPPKFLDDGIRSAIVVPVRSAQPIAALGTYWEQPHAPDASEVRLLQALADSTAIALEGLRLRRAVEDRAAEVTAELGALTYAVSHDLRAPIRHLEGFSRILLQDAGDLHPDIRHGAQRIQDAALNLREMVNGMLTLSRIGQTEVRPQSMDLARLAREVAEALAVAPDPTTGPARLGVVDFTVSPELPVTGDPRLLGTVLQELLGNAWKFTSRTASPRVELGIQPGEPGADPEYFVRDNGVGFEPAAADRLFGLFQRLHGGGDFPGVGVGLASVKRIVESHGGKVRAIGVPESGATFFFTLPR